MKRRSAIGLALAVLLGVSSSGCDRAEPLVAQTDGNFPQPRRYDARGAARIEVGSLELPGTFSVRYFMLPEDRVVITSLEGELEDQVIRRRRIFGRDVEIPMRCNTASLADEARGTSSGGSSLAFPAGSLLIRGLTFDRRGAGDGCPATDGALGVVGANRAEATGAHEPASGGFALVGPLELELGGETRRGTLTLEGGYVNRPPVARIGSRAEGLYDFLPGGCPPVEGQSESEGREFTWPDPPRIAGNRPDGLEAVFRSVSTDPDGYSATAPGNESPRLDLATEQWAHWREDEYRSLGRGYELPPVLFEPGVLHRVLLTVTDRSGARSQAECRFFVAR